MNSFQVASASFKAQRSLNGMRAPDWSAKIPDMPNIELPSQQEVTEGLSAGWQSLRKRVMGDTPPMSRSTSQNSLEKEVIPPVGQPVASTSNSNGSSMWTKLISAVQLPSGDDGYESDQDGYKGESHLTRVMKEYYIARVESASQLPSWLFPPEQRQASRAWTDQSQSSRYDRTDRMHSNSNNYNRTAPSSRYQTSTSPTEYSSPSIFSEIPNPTSNQDRFSRKRSDDSGYSSSSQQHQQQQYRVPSVNRTGMRTSDKLRAMKRPELSTPPQSYSSEDSLGELRRPMHQQGLPSRGGGQRMMI